MEPETDATGHRNKATKFFICLTSREHTSTLSSSIADQRKMLETFLIQWEEGLEYDIPAAKIMYPTPNFECSS